MDDLSMTRSVARDLQDVGVLYLRRQCSIGVLRVNFDRATTRLRWISPGGADVLRAYIDELDDIDRRPNKEQFGAVSALLERFDRWVRSGAKPPVAPSPAQAKPPEPIPATPEAPAPSPPALRLARARAAEISSATPLSEPASAAEPSPLAPAPAEIPQPPAPPPLPVDEPAEVARVGAPEEGPTLIADISPCAADGIPVPLDDFDDLPDDTDEVPEPARGGRTL